MNDVERAECIAKLAETRDSLSEAVKGLSAAQATFKPAADQWSVEQIVEHVALAEHGRGRPEAAKKLLQETSAWLDQPQAANPAQKNSATLLWTDRVQVEQLRRELETLLKDKGP